MNPVIYPDGSQIWWHKDKFHREDGPAVIHNNGTKKWYKDGEFHRLDGPAIIFEDGRECWYVNGHICRNWNEFQKQSEVSDEDLSVLRLKYNIS